MKQLFENLFLELQNDSLVIASPNWVDILSLVTSILAIVVAGIVAYRQVDISKQQNKIALFELRYKMYNRILDCNHFARFICILAKENKDIFKIYEMTVRDRNPAAGMEHLDDSVLISEMLSFVGELEKVEFLFSHDVAQYSTLLSSELVLTITNCLVLKENYIEASKTTLKGMLDDFDKNKIHDKMAAELQIITKPKRYK